MSNGARKIWRYRQYPLLGQILSTIFGVGIKNLLPKQGKMTWGISCRKSFLSNCSWLWSLGFIHWELLDSSGDFILQQVPGHELTAQCVYMLSLQSCSTLCDPVDCSPPGSSVPGIHQTRILEWVAMSSSRGTS